MFEQFMGRRQMELFEHPLTRRGVELWLERVLGFYGEQGGVDIEVIEGHLALTEKTAAYLYSDFTPSKMPYVRGSRPMLEGVLEQVLRPGMSPREMALAIMRRVRDNQDMGLARPDLFCGGDEEDLLRRGARMCNEVSRLFCCLCQMANLPARMFSAHITGHSMAEVRVDGKWWWIDPMMGLAPVDSAGQPVSAWDLHRQPAIFDRQPRAVWDDIRAPWTKFGPDQRNSRNRSFVLAYHRDAVFHRHEAMALGNYFVWEKHRYTYPWRIDPADPARLLEARLGEARNRMALGWPDHYQNWQVFDEFRDPPQA